MGLFELPTASTWLIEQNYTSEQTAESQGITTPVIQMFIKHVGKHILLAFRENSRSFVS
jgi:hypothetical protein